VTTAAAYLRVSSRGQTLDTQRDAIARAAEARGDVIGIGWWFEEKVSSAKLARPVLSELRQSVREGLIRKVYVFKIDRLGRSGIRDTLTIVDELRAHGCEIASVVDPFPLSGPLSDVVIAVIAWGAQMERQAVGDRIAAARIRIEASGGAWGRPRAIDPGTLAKARAMRRDDKTVRQISAALKIPRATLSDALSEKGHYRPKHPGLAKSSRAR